MNLASRGDLLAPKKRRFGETTLPASGLSVRFRSLMEMEYAELEVARMERDDSGNFVAAEEPLKLTRARLIVACLCDDQGERIFSDADAGELAESLDVADSVFLYVALRNHCGVNGNYDEIRARREDAKKNLNGAPVGASP